MSGAVVVVLGLALAFITYFVLERLGWRGLGPTVARAVVWSALGILLINASCPRAADQVRALVLLDHSLSMGGPGGRWTDAQAAARQLGEVRPVATRPGAPDTAPSGGNSHLAPAVEAALAAGRPVWIVTDGEVDDAAELPPGALGQVGVKLFARRPLPDLAISRVDGPTRVTAGDSVRFDIDVVGIAMPDRNRVEIEIRDGNRSWFRRTAPVTAGSGRVTIEGPVPDVSAGSHLLEVRLVNPGDTEPRTDTRLHLLTITPTPGLVVIAAPASWESKFFFAALTEVASLPVRGYLANQPNQWRRMGDLRPAAGADVEQAVERADLLVTFGDAEEWTKRSRARARWQWTATARTSVPVEGDWYLAAPGASPIAGAFVGAPLDSFPPAAVLTAIAPAASAWIGMTAQLGRRGAERPAVAGQDSAGRRQVTVAVGGLWRWAFRGGSSEQVYRSWVAATTSWLLAGSDTAGGAARPRQAVVQQGRPVVFERVTPDSTPIPIQLTGPTGTRRDTLRFDGAGRAQLFLVPGVYQYRLERGGAGTLGVEQFSDEWLPKPVALHDQTPSARPVPARTPVREKLWLFALAVVGLSCEWVWRRRLGLR